MCIDEMNKLNVYKIMVFFYFLSQFLSSSLSLSSMATTTMTTTATDATTLGDDNLTHDDGNDLDLVSKRRRRR
jgi:hypothetical protein